MKTRPILFSAPMVRALLAGTKTQTRRAVKGMALDWLRPGVFTPEFVADPANGLCPYGVPGDRLWVKETHAINVPGCERGLSYRADHNDPKGDGPANPMRWIPSIHMRRAYSRILLEVTDVRVERVQDISEADAQAEGIERQGDGWRNYFRERESLGGPLSKAQASFFSLWESINGTDSLATNPWVWVVSFRKVVTQ